MEPGPRCEHDWMLILSEETWSGPRRVSGCSLCHASLSEYLPGATRSRRRPVSATQAYGTYIRDQVRGGSATRRARVS